MSDVLAVIAGLLAGPLLGGLITGFDRRLTARLQSRRGPPILQPFWDIIKLFGKEKLAANRFQVFAAHAYVTAAALSLVLLFLQGDLLLIFFVQAVGATFLVLGAFSVPSPYSQVGAHRELLQVLAYEPLLIAVLASIYLVTDSFEVSAILARDRPLLLDLPFAFFVLGYALTIKLRKSPFDFSTSHHGHQELVKGVLTEYSGPVLALVELAHWYESVLILALCALFWAPSVYGMLLIVLALYVLEVLVDNVLARLTWRWMLKYVWSVGFALLAVNVVWLYVS